MADGRKPEDCGARRESGGAASRTSRKASERLTQVRKAGQAEELEENSLGASWEEAEGSDGGYEDQRKLEESATGKS